MVLTVVQSVVLTVVQSVVLTVVQSVILTVDQSVVLTVVQSVAPLFQVLVCSRRPNCGPNGRPIYGPNGRPPVSGAGVRPLSQGDWQDGSCRPRHVSREGLARPVPQGGLGVHGGAAHRGRAGQGEPEVTQPCVLAEKSYHSSSSLSHFYVGSMWDDSRLHAARSYTSSPDSPSSLRSSFTTILPPLLLYLLLLHLYPTSMWGRCGTTVASVQLGRTPLPTVPPLSDRLLFCNQIKILALSGIRIGSVSNIASVFSIFAGCY